MARTSVLVAVLGLCLVLGAHAAVSAKTAAKKAAPNAAADKAAAAGKPAASASTSKLVELITKKSYDDFIVELAAAGMDVNQPDSRGRLPLMEAVRSKETRYVDALIQFGAQANSKDPATGQPPLQLAFKEGLIETARLLLAYGADPDATDKTGKATRQFQPSPDIAALVKQYDADNAHAMAFEDPPGTWIKATNDKDQKYWFNTKTEEARWNIPPSCGWQRVQFQGQPNKYMNFVTGQHVVKTPAPVAWRFLHQAGQDIWYNWVVNISQVAKPDEMPADMLEEAMNMKNVRWYNAKTQEFSWEDPRFHTPWREVLEEGADKPYYFNVATGESQWDVPAELAWKEVPSEDHPGRNYWFNAKTGESTWEAPDSKSWQMHVSDL